jgi:hypothetical protein
MKEVTMFHSITGRTSRWVRVLGIAATLGMIAGASTLPSQPALAQPGTGTINIREEVLGDFGEIDRNAKLGGSEYILSGDNGFSETQQSGPDGMVSFRNLAAGDYTLTINPGDHIDFAWFTLGQQRALNGSSLTVPAGASFDITMSAIQVHPERGHTSAIVIFTRIGEAGGNALTDADASGFSFSFARDGQETVTVGPTDASGFTGTVLARGHYIFSTTPRPGCTLVYLGVNGVPTSGPIQLLTVGSHLTFNIYADFLCS